MALRSSNSTYFSSTMKSSLGLQQCKRVQFHEHFPPFVGEIAVLCPSWTALSFDPVSNKELRSPQNGIASTETSASGAVEFLCPKRTRARSPASIIPTAEISSNQCVSLRLLVSQESALPFPGSVASSFFSAAWISFSFTMCKAFFIRHSCNHASAPRVEKCPRKTRFGECNGVKRIEVKGPTPCATCTAGPSSVDQRKLHAPSFATNLLAPEPQQTVNKKTKGTYGWMKAPNQPSQKQTQLRANNDTATVTEKAMPVVTNHRSSTKTDEKKAKQAEARARNTAKKRNFRDALDEFSGKPAPKKKKKKADAEAAAALPSPNHIRTPLSPVKKPRKKAPPTRLDLEASNTAPKPRKPTKPTSTPATNPSPGMTPKSKTIASLARLNVALGAKLRSFGYSPTRLHPGLFSPAEIARLAESTLIKPSGLQRSPRLTPEARAEVFLDTLSRQMAGAVADGGTVRTVLSPRGGTGADASPDQDELDEFERVMMESPSPKKTEGGRVVGQAVGSGRGDGLFDSSESEEE